MKIAKTYTLHVNKMLGVATFGTSRFSLRANKYTVGEVYDCSFNELIHNLKILSLNFSIQKWK